MSFFSKIGGADNKVVAPKGTDLLAALRMHVRGELEPALAAYASISENAPDDKLAPFFAAAIKAGAGNMAEAVHGLRTLSRDIAAAGENISRAITLELVELLGEESVTVKFPAVAGLAAAFGDILKEAGLLKESCVCFEVATGLAPDNAHLLHKLGDTLHDLGVYDYAESVLQEALKCAPNHWGALYTYALLLQDLGRMEEAISLYQQAVTLDPNHANCQNNYGAVLLNVGRYEEALAHCTAAAALDSASPLVKNNLGFIHLMRQEYAAARTCFTGAIALNEKMFPAYFGLAAAERALGSDPKRIQELYLKAIEINPTAAEPHHALAKVLAGEGDQQALLHFSTAAVLNGDLKDLHKDYGFACLQLGKREQALEQFKQALQQNPDDTVVKEMMARMEAERTRQA